MLSLCCAVDDVVLCCIIPHRILLTLDLVAAKTLVVFYVMVLCKYVTGPIVCPNLNISSVMVNKLNDWLGDGAGARHRPCCWHDQGPVMGRTSPHPLGSVPARLSPGSYHHHAQTQTQQIQEEHPQPPGLRPGPRGGGKDSGILGNQEAGKER